MADDYVRDPFAIMLSDILSRIKRGRDRTYVYAVGAKVFTCGQKSQKKLRKLDREGELVGVYTGVIDRDSLSADISMVIDEIPEPDEFV